MPRILSGGNLPVWLVALLSAVACLTHCLPGFAAAKTQSSPAHINVPAGFKTKSFSVEMSHALAGASLRYSVDGAEPSLSGGFEYRKALQISSNTVLRCAAFQNSQRISPITTRTFLFLEQVLHQPPNPAGFPSGRDEWGGGRSVYGMDPRIVDAPNYRDRIKDAFKSLPVLSIVCRTEDLFSPGKGIYVNSMQRGEGWERPCSAEFILTNGVTAFQVDCGVRIQGNSNRIPAKSPKHSFRLVFKEKYGSSKLHYPVFPETRVEKFDTLLLRADYNNSWVHWNEVNRVRAQRVRDAWMKDSQRAMGWLAGHNRYVHLFLNGLYWGIYDLAERPDAHFAASYFGGKPEDYDVINEGQAKDGTMDTFNRLHSLGNLARLSQFELLKKQLNLTEFIDYLLLQFYTGNQDVGEDKNWYAIGRRQPPGPFTYLVWDGEQIFHSLHDDTVNWPEETPFRLGTELRGNAEFRLAFADRVQKHFFGKGALTPSAVVQRWQQRASEVDLAMIAESARWGYCRRNPPYTHDGDYLQEQTRLLTGYFPQRTAIVLEQLRKAELYPTMHAPVITPSETKAASDYSVSMHSPSGGTIYFTMDGTDPRAYGTGAVSPEAQPFRKTVTISKPFQLKARVFNNGTWSALAEFDAAR